MKVLSRKSITIDHSIEGNPWIYDLEFDCRRCGTTYQLEPSDREKWWLSPLKGYVLWPRDEVPTTVFANCPTCGKENCAVDFDRLLEHRS